MKKVLLLFPIIILALSPISADAPSFDVIPVQRRVLINNASDVPGVMIVAMTQSNTDGNYRIELLDNTTWIEFSEPYETVTIVAVPHGWVEVRSLQDVDYPDLIEGKLLKQTMILQPLQEYRPSENVWIHTEEAVYRIGVIAEDQVFLNLVSLKQYYQDGTGKESIYIKNPGEITSRETLVRARAFTSSSSLEDPMLHDRYSAAAAFDGNIETGWSEGAAGPGFGQYLEVELTNTWMIDSIIIYPGWFQKPLHGKNCRVRLLEIYLDDQKFDAEFTDSMTPQTISLGKQVRFSKARFVIKAVYPTGKWDDTPIAEIIFMNGERSIKVNTDIPGTPPTTDFDNSPNNGR